MATQSFIFEKDQLASFYSKYEKELKAFSEKMHVLYHRMQHRGFSTTFGDVEGELLYLAIRELKPNVCFEISPNAGWSTNYILAALNENGKGSLHSFEILTRLNGKAIDEVIFQNLLDPSFRERLVLHIGDARETTKSVTGTIDMVLLDSCHDDAFARWYSTTILPRLNGVVLIHDIAFVDQLEKSSESKYVWNWLREERVPFQLVGEIERDLSETRKKMEIVERRPYRCNSVIFSWPPAFRSASAWRELPALDYSERIPQLLTNLNDEEAVRALCAARLNLIKNEIHIVNRHRELFNLAKLFDERGSRIEAGETNRMALELALQCDYLKRKQALIELFYGYVSRRYLILTVQVFFRMIKEPAIFLEFLRYSMQLVIKRR